MFHDNICIHVVPFPCLLSKCYMICTSDFGSCTYLWHFIDDSLKLWAPEYIRYVINYLIFMKSIDYFHLLMCLMEMWGSLGYFRFLKCLMEIWERKILEQVLV